MSKPKEPFVGYTFNEILSAEATNYVVQVGSEIFNNRGTWSFSKRSANTYYNKILAQVLYQLKNGTVKEKLNAKRMICNLRVLPLRIH